LPREPTKRAMARIQRLCCLGLGGQLVMPALIDELHGLIGFGLGQFYWAGPNQELANVYSDAPDPAQIASLYLSEFHDKRERNYVYTFAQTMRTRYPSPVDDMNRRALKVGLDEFLKSDLYNLVHRPLGLHHCVQLKVTELGRGQGAMLLSRAETELEFSKRECQILEAVEPFLAHALKPGAVDMPLVESDDRALVIAAADGRIEHMTVGAKRLLLMATLPTWSPRDAPPGHSMSPSDLVTRMCRDVVGVFEDRLPQTPPARFYRNSWGGFELRAYFLASEKEMPSKSLVGIAIVRHEPLALRLARRAEALPLSPREIEFCLLAAAGHSRGDIAERMGVSAHTAITHGRNVYAKLRVDNRVALFNKLRAL
jgi:DNA-binding CsgD family transcriptional regulator